MSATKNNPNFEIAFTDASNENDYGYRGGDMTPFEEQAINEHEREVTVHMALAGQYDMEAPGHIFNKLFGGEDVGKAFDKMRNPEWHFIEIANDIRNIKNQLIEKIKSL
jgi:hypothetical protein